MPLTPNLAPLLHPEQQASRVARQSPTKYRKLLTKRYLSNSELVRICALTCGSLAKAFGLLKMQTCNLLGMMKLLAIYQVPSCLKRCSYCHLHAPIPHTPNPRSRACGCKSLPADAPASQHASGMFALQQQISLREALSATLHFHATPPIGSSTLGVLLEKLRRCGVIRLVDRDALFRLSTCCCLLLLF